MIRKKAIMGRMVARMRAGVERPSLGGDEADDEVEESGGGVEVEVEMEEEEEDEGGPVEGDETVDETEAVDDMAVLAEVGETVIGIGIMGEGVFPVAVVMPSSVPLGSTGKPVAVVAGVGSVVGDTEPPKVHPSPRGIEGP
jgi:hypothetical protein